MLLVASTAAAIFLLARRVSAKKKHPVAIVAAETHTSTRGLGVAKVPVTVLGMGGASIGDMYVKISNAQAVQTLEAAHAHGVTFFDTSPWYGVGLSEARFGIALHSVPRDSFFLQTKVGRYLVPDSDGVNGTKLGWIGGFHFGIRFDYSKEGFQRQLEDSLQRTGLGRIDSLVIHDLEPTPRNGTQEEKIELAMQDLRVLEKSGYDYLVAQRAAGKILTFGAGVNSNEDGEDLRLKREYNKMYVNKLVELHKTRGEIDFLLLANMWSLLNFEAFEDGIVQLCSKNGISVVVGGPYSSGILATGADPEHGGVPYYNYMPADNTVRERCRRVEQVCKRFGVPLIAAAIQFPLLHPSVCSVIPGGKSKWEVDSNVKNMNFPIPLALWYALRNEGLLPLSLKLPPMPRRRRNE